MNNPGFQSYCQTIHFNLIRFFPDSGTYFEHGIKPIFKSFVKKRFMFATKLINLRKTIYQLNSPVGQ
jgi:hypothetical protein